MWRNCPNLFHRDEALCWREQAQHPDRGVRRSLQVVLIRHDSFLSTLSTAPTAITILIYYLIKYLNLFPESCTIFLNRSLFNIVGRFNMDMIKVSANSRTSAVAGAIAGVVREHKRAEVQAIGAGAVNQAVKALVLATGYLKNDGIDVVCVPEFADVTIEDKVRTAIKLVIEPR
jgi:stage V sporulation protein S